MMWPFKNTPIVACKDCKWKEDHRGFQERTRCLCEASYAGGVFQSVSGKRNPQLCWFMNTDGHCKHFEQKDGA